MSDSTTTYELHLDTRSRERYKVAALVSVYNSAAVIRGCLKDLAGQSLYRRGELEIVLIDSASPQVEWEVIEEFACTHPHLVAARTSEREPLYQAWNRAIALSRAAYLTNANTDDRHRPDGLEMLARELDSHPEAALVYGDSYLSFRANETWDDCPRDRTYRYPAFFAPGAILHYQFGPHPMWRSSVHQTLGFFDHSYRAAGDYDFNLRFNRHFRAHHLPQPVGIYLERPDAITFKDDTMARENKRIEATWKTTDYILELYRAEGAPVDTEHDQARVLVDMGIRALAYFPPWLEGKVERNLRLAQVCFRRAARLDPGWIAPLHNLAVCLTLQGRISDGLKLLDSAGAENPDFKATRQHLYDIIGTGVRNGGVKLIPSGLNFSSQQVLFNDSQEIIEHSNPVREIISVPNRTEYFPVGENSSVRSFNILINCGKSKINPHGCNGGMETAVLQAGKALASRGHSVTVAGEINNWNGNDVIINSPGGNFNLISAGRINSIPEPDIHCFTSGPGWRDRMPAGDTPSVLLFHHQALEFMGEAGLEAVEDSARVICVSDAVRRNLISHGAPPEKLRVVPNGVDLDLFRPRNSNNHRVDNGSVKIMFVGALVPDKNPHTLIEAFIALSPRHPAAELHIFGNAGLWGAQEYLDRDAIRHINHRIHFHGAVAPAELVRWYSEATLCVIPSRYESFGLVSLEAQACGCVPVVANTGGLPETILTGETGFIYHPNDATTLARLLDKLISSPDLIKNASRSGIEFVRAKFSWRKTAEGYEKVFNKLLSDVEAAVA